MSKRISRSRSNYERTMRTAQRLARANARRVTVRHMSSYELAAARVALPTAEALLVKGAGR